MRRTLMSALLGAVLVGCASEMEPELELPVVDLREAGSGGGSGVWLGDTLIVDTPCLGLHSLGGMSLDDACDVLLGGVAHTGEDRVAATVFDDPSCLSAAGFLPRPGGDGSAVLPGGDRGVILRCAVQAEPS